MVKFRFFPYPRLPTLSVSSIRDRGRFFVNFSRSIGKVEFDDLGEDEVFEMDAGLHFSLDAGVIEKLDGHETF